jgi:integrase
VSLAEARSKAAEARKLVGGGVNPSHARKAAKQAQGGRKTFGEAAEAFLTAKSHEWRNAKHHAQWRMTLERYCAPVWAKPVADIATADVLAVLQSLWQSRPETASRLRGRVEAVLDAAKAHGQRQGENPARWRGHLDKLLPKRQKLTREHHAAMPYADVPAFVASLREREAIAAMVLEFCILTAARSGEVLGARWPEVDFEAKVWTVPAARTKAGRQHRSPLSLPALAILERLSEARTFEFVFADQRPGKPLSAMALEMVLRRGRDGSRLPFCLPRLGWRLHAFLAQGLPWRTLRAMQLSVLIGAAVHFEKRRELLEAWANYLDAFQAKVIAFARPGLA